MEVGGDRTRGCRTSISSTLTEKNSAREEKRKVLRRRSGTRPNRITKPKFKNLNGSAASQWGKLRDLGVMTARSLEKIFPKLKTRRTKQLRTPRTVEIIKQMF